MPSYDNIGSYLNPFTGATIAGQPGTRAEANSFLANRGFSSMAPGQSMLAAQAGVASGLGGQAVNKERERKDQFYAGLNQQNQDYAAMAQQMAQQMAQTRAAQAGLIAQLQGQANGTGPSLAQAQLQQATDRNMQQAMALGVSQRGAGQAAMLHNIANQRAGIGQQMAGDSATLRLQEQMAAQQQLGGLLGGMYGADMQGRQFGMGQGTGLSLAQEQMRMQQNQFDRADRLAWEQARLGQSNYELNKSNSDWSHALGIGSLGLGMAGGLFSGLSRLPGGAAGGTGMMLAQPGSIQDLKAGGG